MSFPTSRSAALLRRYRTTLFLIALSLLAAVAIVQSLRLHYLEQRHATLLRDFGKDTLLLKSRIGELATAAARCETPAAKPGSPADAPAG